MARSAALLLLLLAACAASGPEPRSAAPDAPEGRVATSLLGWVACEPGRVMRDGRCVTGAEAAVRDVHVYDTRILAGTERGREEGDFGDCCRGRGGVAEMDAMVACLDGRVLCRNGELSPDCAC